MVVRCLSIQFILGRQHFGWRLGSSLHTKTMRQSWFSLFSFIFIIMNLLFFLLYSCFLAFKQHWNELENKNQNPNQTSYSESYLKRLLCVHSHHSIFWFVVVICICPLSFLFYYFRVLSLGCCYHRLLCVLVQSSPTLIASLVLAGLCFKLNWFRPLYSIATLVQPPLLFVDWFDLLSVSPHFNDDCPFTRYTRSLL